MNTICYQYSALTTGICNRSITKTSAPVCFVNFYMCEMAGKREVTVGLLYRMLHEIPLLYHCPSALSGTLHAGSEGF